MLETPNPMCMEREVQELVWGLVRALKPKKIVETGSYHGSTSEVIGNALESNDYGYLLSIESDEQWVEAARSRCAHLPRVMIVHADSLSFGRAWKSVAINMLIVDGSDDRDDEFEASQAARHLAGERAGAGGMTKRCTARLSVSGSLTAFTDAVNLNTPRGISLSQRPVVRA